MRARRAAQLPARRCPGRSLCARREKLRRKRGIALRARDRARFGAKQPAIAGDGHQEPASQCHQVRLRRRNHSPVADAAATRSAFEIHFTAAAHDPASEKSAFFELSTPAGGCKQLRAWHWAGAAGALVSSPWPWPAATRYRAPDGRLLAIGLPRATGPEASAFSRSVVCPWRPRGRGWWPPEP